MSTKGVEREIREAVYDKPTVNIMLNNEKLKAFPLRSGKRQDTTFIQHSIEISNLRTNNKQSQ